MFRKEPLYFPFNNIVPYPKFLCINIYSGYILTDAKRICITHPDQMPAAQRVQNMLAQLGFQWEISLHSPDEGRENVGVQFEIKALEKGTGAYTLDVEIYYPDHGDDGIISLIANDLTGIEKGVNTLIQVLQLSFERFGDIASLWIRDWEDTDI